MVDVSSMFSVLWDVAATADCEQVSLTQGLSESQTESSTIRKRERVILTAFSLEVFCEYDPWFHVYVYIYVYVHVYVTLIITGVLPVLLVSLLCCCVSLLLMVSKLLVFVGSLPQLVSHHSSWEVVEVQHVLEEAVLWHVILETQESSYETGVQQQHLTAGGSRAWPTEQNAYKRYPP